MAPWTRRELLAAAAGVTALPLTEVTAAPKMPRRAFGRTGMKVSILGLGGGSQFLAACHTDDEVVTLLETAIAGGINYFDNGASYGDGESERRYGLVLPRYRNRVYLTSKTLMRDREGALREIERSLANLRTDYLDLMQVHLIQPDEDLDRLLGKNGLFPLLLELKRQKVVRAIGVTGHLSATRMRLLVERLGQNGGLDTVLCPVNPARDSREFVLQKDDTNPDGHFEQLLLPAARRYRLGIAAMKVVGQAALIGRGPGKADARTLVRYALSQPGVAVAVIGPGSLEHLRQNIRIAQKFRPMSPRAGRRLEQHISSAMPLLAYRQPGYRGC